TIITGNLNLSARWRFTITFNGNGGQTPNPLILTSGITVGELPRPTRDNHRFLGWATSQTGGNVLHNDILIEGNATLWARWEVFRRIINIPTTISGIVNGLPRNLNPRENWFSFQGNAPVIHPDTNRYRIVVGPRVMNPNYPDNGRIWGSDFNFPILIDILLEHMTTNQRITIGCIATSGAKAHTFNIFPTPEHPRNNFFTNDTASFNIESGIFQTGISYPNASNVNSELQFAINNIDSSTIEFVGRELRFTPNNYRLLQIIVY
ncbi:MAG: InlB B-repeat-containing protein, partial [Defluviitaleaceae bacterium]|nr:InlB B-repeat-containing protein [Defluviitaleaceae bacterium]